MWKSTNRMLPTVLSDTPKRASRYSYALFTFSFLKKGIYKHIRIRMIAKIAMFPAAYDQSDRNACSGVDIYVMALNVVAYMVKPAAHVGMLPPAVKNESVLFPARFVK